MSNLLKGEQERGSSSSIMPAKPDAIHQLLPGGGTIAGRVYPSKNEEAIDVKPLGNPILEIAPRVYPIGVAPSRERQNMILGSIDASLVNDRGKQTVNDRGKQRPRSVFKSNFLEVQNVLPVGASPVNSVRATFVAADDKCTTGGFPAKQKLSASRKNVEKVLKLYNEVVADFILQCKPAQKFINMTQLYIDAARNLDKHNKCLNTKRQLGPVPGIEIGDRFKYRAVLKVIGLHHPFSNGIDYMKKDGICLATSIVVSGRYANCWKSDDVLIYTGNGGNPCVGSKVELKDQKMQRGNLALKNSMEKGTPVRVIYRVAFKSCKGSAKEFMFVYDGLYLVEDFWQERGEYHKLVFRFLLKRIVGQPKLNWRSIKNSRERASHEDDLWRSYTNHAKDNTPTHEAQAFAVDGCDCIDGCSDSEDCSCKIKNGGEMPYDYNECVVRRRPFIYECGKSCKCYESCLNRVSQRCGDQCAFLLEAFRPNTWTWGIRSKTRIPSGSFVCDYTREIPLKKGSKVKVGIVGQYIRHHYHPNLYVQKVVYEDGDAKRTHRKLFALREIPPWQELTYDHSIL